MNFFKINELLRGCTVQERYNFLSNETYVNNMLNLVGLLNFLRSKFGKPFVITSCARDIAHNRRVGGVESSQHLTWSACDFYVVGMSVHDVYSRIYQLVKYPTIVSEKISIGQCIIYPSRNILHISIADNKHLNQFLQK